MPGRLEFEHEVDNDAELVVKDFEFGIVLKYGGHEQPQAKITRGTVEEEDRDEEDEEKDRSKDDGDIRVKEEPMDDQPEASGSRLPRSSSPARDESGKEKGKGKAKAEHVVVFEEEDELEVKLALLDIYFSKLDEREEAKDIIFDRALTEHKRVRPLLPDSGAAHSVQIQAMERKRPKDERELIQRYKVFAKLQTASDFEVLVEGLICE